MPEWWTRTSFDELQTERPNRLSLPSGGDAPSLRKDDPAPNQLAKENQTCRGLGVLQKGILAVLAENGSWFYAWEIACEVCEKRATEPTLTFDVSVRRAVNSLAKRGLVRTGENRDKRYRKRGDAYGRLAVWLPDQTAPEDLIVPLDGQQVAAQVRSHLQSAPEQRPYFSGRYESLRPQFEAGDVQYCDLQGVVSSRLAITNWERQKVNAATRRAILRLEKAGEVTVKRASNGDIGLIRLRL